MKQQLSVLFDLNIYYGNYFIICESSNPVSRSNKNQKSQLKKLALFLFQLPVDPQQMPLLAP